MSAYDTVYAHMVRLRRQEAGQDGWELADALGKVLEVVCWAEELADSFAPGKAADHERSDLLENLKDALAEATEDNGP